MENFKLLIVDDEETFIEVLRDRLTRKGLNVKAVNSGLDAIKWVRRAVDLGAGEIVVNSIDGDGMKKGYDIKLLKKIKDSVDVPVIASGGAGKFEDFYEVIMLAKVDGVLAASVFHYGDIKINDLKEYLIDKGIYMKHWEEENGYFKCNRRDKV